MQQLKKLLHTARYSIVMKRDDQTIGFANLSYIQKHNIAFLTNLIISKKFRRQGYGQQLIHYMQQLALTEFKVQQLHISCYQNNKPALNLYQKLGFHSYAQESRKDWQHNEAILIHLKLLFPL